VIAFCTKMRILIFFEVVMGLYRKFSEALGNNPNFGYLLNRNSLQQAFHHLDDAAENLGHLKDSQIAGQASAFDQWGTRFCALETVCGIGACKSVYS